MGYPFDRRFEAPIDNLDALTSAYGNMRKSDVTILFTDKVIDKN